MRSLVFLSVLAFAGFFLTLSSLPLHALAIGTGAGAAGLVTTVMLVSTVATQTLVPAVVSRVGLVRVFAAGLILLGAPAPLYLLGDDFAWLLVVSAVRGTGFAVVTVLLPLAASGLVPPHRRGEAIGLYGLAIAIPNLLAVPAGVALTSAGHFAVVSLLAAAPLLALPFLPRVGRALLPTRSAGAGEPALPGGSPVVASEAVVDRVDVVGVVDGLAVGDGHAVGDGGAVADAGRPAAAAVRAVAPTVLVLLAVTLAGGGVLTFLPVARPSGALATTALLVFGGTGALARWRAGALADRVGTRLLLPSAVLVAALGMGVLALGLGSAASAVVLLGAALLGIGYGSVQNVSLLVAFDRAGPANQATASAAWNAAFDAGTAIGALVVGLVATGTALGRPGFPWTFGACGVLVLLVLPLAVGAVRAVPADRARP